MIKILTGGKMKKKMIVFLCLMIPMVTLNAEKKQFDFWGKTYEITPRGKIRYIKNYEIKLVEMWETEKEYKIHILYRQIISEDCEFQYYERLDSFLIHINHEFAIVNNKTSERIVLRSFKSNIAQNSVYMDGNYIYYLTAAEDILYRYSIEDQREEKVCELESLNGKKIFTYNLYIFNNSNLAIATHSEYGKFLIFSMNDGRIVFNEEQSTKILNKNFELQEILYSIKNRLIKLSVKNNEIIQTEIPTFVSNKEYIDDLVILEDYIIIRTQKPCFSLFVWLFFDQSGIKYQGYLCKLKDDELIMLDKFNI